VESMFRAPWLETMTASAPHSTARTASSPRTMPLTISTRGHSVDKMAWWLGDAMPVKAVATGSRLFPVEGNTFDNCFVAYEYASGLRGFLACRAHAGCHSDYSDYIIGTKGTCTVSNGRVPEIQGETNWRYAGVMNNMHQTEQDELFASIRAGKPINDGTRMAETTLMALMGRMAAYTGQEITWEQALHSQESLVPEVQAVERTDGQRALGERQVAEIAHMAHRGLSQKHLARVPGGPRLGRFQNRQQLAVGADGLGHPFCRRIGRNAVAEPQELHAFRLDMHGRKVGQRIGRGPDMLAPLPSEESDLQHREWDGFLNAERSGSDPLQPRQMGSGRHSLT